MNGFSPFITASELSESGRGTTNRVSTFVFNESTTTISLRLQ